MIVLFTANTQGGIIQLACELLKKINNLGKPVCCFMPSGSVVTVSDELKDKVVFYKKIVTLSSRNKEVRKLASEILSMDPELIWFVDDSPLAAEIGTNLLGKVKQIFSQHDVFSHPTHNRSISYKIVHQIKLAIRDKFMKKVDYIVTYSSVSAKLLAKQRPSLSQRILTIPLGAHIPDTLPSLPVEVRGRAPYLLFFGRIDKYKGIYRLLEAYKMQDKCSLNLVIAGSGKLEELEIEYIKHDSRIVLLNRYINDGEMLALFQNCTAVLLPYIEASQSGIIPIAYKLSKPVAVSDCPGLIQFVRDKETGFVCNDVKDFSQAIFAFEDGEYASLLGANAKKYYDEHLDWECNIKKLFVTIGVKVG